MVDDVHAGFREAGLVADVERLGPGRVLAHDRDVLELETVDQQILGRVADELGLRGRGQIAVEGVLVLLVVVMDRLRDLVGGRARRDQRHLQPRRPRLQRQHDFTDVAGDDRADLVLADRALERAHGIGRRALVVVGDDLDLAAEDAALGVDLVGGDLRAARGRGARDRLHFGDHADLDGVAGLRIGRRGKTDGGSGGRKRSPPAAAEVGRSWFSPCAILFVVDRACRMSCRRNGRSAKSYAVTLSVGKQGRSAGGRQNCLLLRRSGRRRRCRRQRLVRTSRSAASRPSTAEAAGTHRVRHRRMALGGGMHRAAIDRRQHAPGRVMDVGGLDLVLDGHDGVVVQADGGAADQSRGSSR